MNPSSPSPEGACYRLRVGSAEEAATVIRGRFGERARVLSISSVEAPGLSRFWSSPRLEVVVSVDAAAEAPEEPAGPVPAAADFPTALETASDRGSLAELLLRSGVSDIVLGRLQVDPAWPSLLELPLHRALVKVGLRLRRSAEAGSPSRKLARAAFLSSPGSGRTTALCKWLAMQTMRSGNYGQVVVAEFEQPNPVGALPMFCEALGVPFVRNATASRGALSDGFTYFDMPAFSLRNPARNAPIREFLDRGEIEQRVLVLNMVHDHSALRAAYAAGESLGATHIAFTHLDEMVQWGRVLDFLCDGSLEPLLLSTGPSLTGECTEDVSGAVVRRTLATASEDFGSFGGGDQGARQEALA